LTSCSKTTVFERGSEWQILSMRPSSHGHEALPLGLATNRTSRYRISDDISGTELYAAARRV
ncbi:hypothetical protein, partial [Salmonella enterica]|uniref:hypothetical protein n=1 Tax=Salmonella enterica TaxID=28901 RepID=UPI000D5646B8